MSRKKTLDEVNVEVLEKAGEPLRVEEIYQRITEDGLYSFQSENPVHILRTALRRKSDNLKFKSSRDKKLYVFLKDGTYSLRKYQVENKGSKELVQEDFEITELKEAHNNYTRKFKQSLLKQLQELDPSDFEVFCGNLLKEFGFKSIKVTQQSRDGGIDGHGKLKIGLAWLPVAFECKRYKAKSTIGRPKINQFRGDIQGKFPQGIYFTTSSFSKDAKDASFQAGAAPIVLIDGNGIVDLMIEKEFGIEKEELPIYTNAVDLVLQKQ